MLFPLTAIAVVACVAWTRARDAPRSPLLLALYFWGVSVVLVALPVLKYQVEYSARVDALVATSLLSATVGYFLVRRARSPVAVARASPDTATRTPYERKQIRVCLAVSLLGAIGCLLLLIDARAHGTQLSLSYLIDNIAIIRDDTLDSRLAHSRLFTIGFYLTSCAYISVIAAAYLGRARSRTLMLAGIANFMLIAAVSLFAFGGRTIVTNALLLVAVGAYVSGRRVRISLKTLVGFAAVVVLALYFSTTYFGAREGVINVDRSLVHLERAELRPWIASSARHNQAIGSAVISFGYFASPLATLSWYLQRPSIPGPYGGSFSYPIPTYVLHKAAGTKRWSDVRLEVFEPLEAAGYAGNVWGTWLRDLIVDFGSLGAMLYCCVFGAFLAWARNRADRTGAVHYHVLQVIACATLGFGAFQNLLLVNILSGSFFAAVALMYANRVRLSAVGADGPQGRVSAPGPPTPAPAGTRPGSLLPSRMVR